MIVLENNQMKVSIQEKGAEVVEVFHKEKDLQFMWSGDPAYWGRVSPVLFPIVGRLKNDQYTVDQRIYSLPQHGFLRDSAFRVIQQTNETARLQFATNGRFKDVYPFECAVEISYRLENNRLTFQWKVVNEDKGDMYFSIGAHPAFRIPLRENEQISDYFLEIEPSETTPKEFVLKDALIHEKGAAKNLHQLPLSADLFANDALIFSHIDGITIKSAVNENQINVQFNDFPYVGIWSKYDAENHTIAPFLCIEPWFGIADTHDHNGNFKEKLGINRLSKDGVFQTEFSVSFS
ncbi:aldose 1-epimerase family protein [Priestia sp. TSO9]|uniref:aldose 1-epimerase family protein n=1 Tax=Priestia sp. TSO9 TaxID=2885632 RepID=UPI001E3272DE|nr:aldose 1-epimerase family protein [Priestia sp. TSO9]